MLIDTGSSNTWVGAGKAYVRTETSQATANLVVSDVCSFTSYTYLSDNVQEVTYGSGFVFGKQGHVQETHGHVLTWIIGEAFSDTVTVADGLAIENQVIGSALDSSGFDGVDGIIGYAVFLRTSVLYLH